MFHRLSPHLLCLCRGPELRCKLVAQVLTAVPHTQTLSSSLTLSLSLISRQVLWDKWKRTWSRKEHKTTSESTIQTESCLLAQHKSFSSVCLNGCNIFYKSSSQLLHPPTKPTTTLLVTADDEERVVCPLVINNQTRIKSYITDILQQISCLCPVVRDCQGRVLMWRRGGEVYMDCSLGVFECFLGLRDWIAYTECLHINMC